MKAIHEAMIKTLQTVPWMDRNTRIEAIEKAKRMHFHIAYPNELADNLKLDQYYKGLELLATNTYLQNILQTRKFNDRRYKATLRKPINNTDWESHSLSAYVNAYYLFDENSICKVLPFKVRFIWALIVCLYSITSCYSTRSLLFC